MRKLSIEEAKKLELDILDFIDSFCKEHGINYCINYGTLIGAIRHKGFIPWDDDIDLSMTRENYERFIQLFSEKQSRYKLLSLETDDQYFNNFIKIVDPTTKIIDTRNTKTYDSGVFIDIFPMDTFNDTKVVDICYKLESFKLLSFSKKDKVEIPIYLTPMVMIMEYDVTKTNNIYSINDQYELVSQKGERFPIWKDELGKTRIFLNEPKELKQDIKRFYDSGFRHFRIEFLNEGEDQVRNIIRSYKNYLEG